MTQRELSLPAIKNPAELLEVERRFGVASVSGIRRGSTPEGILSVLQTPIKTTEPAINIPQEMTIGMNSLGTVGVLSLTSAILELSGSILGVDDPSFDQSQALVNVMNQAVTHEHLPPINAAIKYDDASRRGTVTVNFPVLPLITPNIYPQGFTEKLAKLTTVADGILEHSGHTISPIIIRDRLAFNDRPDSGKIREFSCVIQPLK